MSFFKSRSLIIDNVIGKLFFLTAMTCLIILSLIMIFLLKEGLPIFKYVSVKDFLTGNEWYPVSDPPLFGTFPLIISSVSVTVLATLISVPLSMAIAIYISEIAGSKVKEIVKPAVEIIASLPSVVLGFFGMVVIAPFLQNVFKIDTGLNMFNASLMLAFMSIPTIASISEDAISSVPQSLKNASYALGANKWQTIFFITLPAALSGIFTAIILGISRVIGETMVVLMVAGGSTLLPKSIFSPIRPLTSNIAAEMAETAVGDAHYNSLFAIGIILFVITFIFNLAAANLSNKYKFKSN
ncbi:MAG: phosphate ABC transporter permease subunit PstC [Spirochaetes bacterium]|nr:phosphate ABC transporter permease subunit PstC [Spirochaetota bacterium]